MSHETYPGNHFTDPTFEFDRSADIELRSRGTLSPALSRVAFARTVDTDPSLTVVTEIAGSDRIGKASLTYLGRTAGYAAASGAENFVRDFTTGGNPPQPPVHHIRLGEFALATAA